MANRLQALFMLLVFGLVLPAAGAPQRFCGREQTFVRQECCEVDHDCGDCPDEKFPGGPSCVSSAKVFPDGVNPGQLSLPVFASLPLPPFNLPEPVESENLLDIPNSPGDRAPPGEFPPLYLAHRSLLL